MALILAPFLMLFLLIALGAGLQLAGVLDLDFTKRLSRVVVQVTFPAMLFISMYNNIDILVLRQGFLFSLLGLGTSVLLAFSAHYSAKFFGLKEKSYATYQILCTNGNNIFLPVPLILSLYGAAYIVYAFLFELGAGLFYWSYGVSHFRKGPRLDLKRLFNQNMLALLLGLGAAVFNLPLPKFVVGALEIVGNMTIGSALLIIGSLVAGIFEQRLVWRRELWGVIGHRLLLSPILGVLFLKLFPLPPDLARILVLMLAMPPLVTTALVAANYDADENLATLGVVIPTLLALLVLPFLLYFRR